MINIGEVQLTMPGTADTDSAAFVTAFSAQLAAALPANMESKTIERLHIRTTLSATQATNPVAAIPQLVSAIIRQLQFSE